MTRRVAGNQRNWRIALIVASIISLAVIAYQAMAPRGPQAITATVDYVATAEISHEGYQFSSLRTFLNPEGRAVLGQSYALRPSVSHRDTEYEQNRNIRLAPLHYTDTSVFYEGRAVKSVYSEPPRESPAADTPAATPTFESTSLIVPPIELNQNETEHQLKLSYTVSGNIWVTRDTLRVDLGPEHPAPTKAFSGTVVIDAPYVKGFVEAVPEIVWRDYQGIIMRSAPGAKIDRIERISPEKMIAHISLEPGAEIPPLGNVMVSVRFKGLG